jgi:biofilm PGA synthesis N-glycosyltransferase PgaC
MQGRAYILLTAARNEEAYIERTIQSVVNQKALPRRWVVVSDGSTDRTDEIVARYVADYAFLELLRTEPDPERNFGSKTYALRAGYEQVKGLAYDYIGILDADVSFEPDYYERVMERFEACPELGLAGGILYDERNGGYIVQNTQTEWSVSGPIQMFRRACYEEIGGYRPLQRGGIDAVAEVMARMHGWKVQGFADLKVMHHRRTGSEKGNLLVTGFRDGIKEYAFGSHFLFEAAKCLYRIRAKPFLLGSVARMAGYCWASLKREPQPLPRDVIAFTKQEQVRRLRALLPLAPKVEKGRTA